MQYSCQDGHLLSKTTNPPSFPSFDPTGATTSCSLPVNLQTVGGKIQQFAPPARLPTYLTLPIPGAVKRLQRRRCGRLPPTYLPLPYLTLPYYPLGWRCALDGHARHPAADAAGQASAMAEMHCIVAWVLYSTTFQRLDVVRRIKTERKTWRATTTNPAARTDDVPNLHPSQPMKTPIRETSPSPPIFTHPSNKTSHNHLPPI